MLGGELAMLQTPMFEGQEGWMGELLKGRTAISASSGIGLAVARRFETSLRPVPNMMTGESVAAAITSMAELTFDNNLLTSTLLPIAQAYLGRG